MKLTSKEIVALIEHHVDFLHLDCVANPDRIIELANELKAARLREDPRSAHQPLETSQELN